MMLGPVLAWMLSTIEAEEISVTVGDFVYDSWSAYKAYAAYLNWHRPRGHKLSWKMLSRPQRRDAMNWYARMLQVGGIPSWD